MINDVEPVYHKVRYKKSRNLNDWWIGILNIIRIQMV